MSMTACLAIVSDITATDSDAVLAAVDMHRAAGMSAADAHRTAANDLLAEIEAERAEIMRIVRTQHEDLFIAPPPPAPKPEPYKTKFFEPQTKAEAKSLAEDAALQTAWLDERARSMGYSDIDQLVDRDFDAFMELADEWRETNPAEMMMQRVFHGTPYRGIEKFDTTKIGTGEGAQAYGYGLYFAGRKEIAEFYRRTLTERLANDPEFWAGVKLPPGLSRAEITELDGLYALLNKNRDGNGRPLNDAESARWKTLRDKESARTDAINEARPKGQLYEVEIPEDNEFLLWDKRLSEQPAKVIEALAPFIERHKANQRKVMSAFPPAEVEREIAAGLKTITGQELYEQAGYIEAGGDRSASEYLLGLGIRGIKYLDGTSRSAGDGSYNYVLFSGEDAQIAALHMARGTPSRFTLPEFGRAAKTVEALQNRYNRWKQVIETVGKQGGIVSEANDFYRAEERYWGKVASRIEDFGKDVDDFVKALTDDGIDMRSMQLYAYAKHAKERNAYLRTVRAPGAGGFDSWSGMSDADADAIIADSKAAGLDATFDKHHAKLMGWTQGTRDLLLDEGLITDDQYLTLQAAYDNYVPLGGKPGEQVKSKPGTGKGFNIRGKETERARGRYSEADNIIEQIIQARVTALTRAGKNEVLRSFLQFVIENPDPTLWEVNAVETRPVMTVDDQGNQIIEEQRSVVKDDRTVGIKDGGKEVFVKINDKVLREQMKNLNAEEIGIVHGHMLAAQRMLGRLYTSLSPTFTVLNFSRDTMAASLGMLDETGFRGAAKLWKELPRAVVESFRSEFGTASPDYQLFRATGGKTGFMNFRDIPEIAADLQKSIKNFEQGGIDPRVWGPKALRTIEKINAGLENANRFAAFQAARSEGKSLAEAAKVSKNITVNFNRKGTLTNALSAYFLFFNPAVQGTVRVMQGLKSPKTLATLGAGMTGVAMLALQNASMGDDDDGVAWWDKIQPEVKDRNFIIVLPDVPALASTGEPIPGSRNGRYIKVPMPYGWNWFATVANQAADLWRNSIDPARGVTPAKAAARTAGAFLAAYMPAPELTRSFENSKGAAMALVPDFINAPVGAVFNLNAFGRQMYPDYDEKAPDSTKYFAGQAGTIFQRAAAGLNAATGGDAYSSGLLDFTPATLESLTRAYGGGPASFILDTMNAMYVRQSIERPDLDVRRLPFAKQLYGRIDAETDRMLAYERMNTIAEKIDPVERAKKAGNFAAAREYADESGQIAKLGGALKSTRDRLSTLRKQELAIISADHPESVKYARLQSLEQQRRKVLQDINRAYDAAMRAPERAAEPALQ